MASLSYQAYDVKKRAVVNPMSIVMKGRLYSFHLGIAIKRQYKINM